MLKSEIKFLLNIVKFGFGPCRGSYAHPNSGFSLSLYVEHGTVQPNENAPTYWAL